MRTNLSRIRIDAVTWVSMGGLSDFFTTNRMARLRHERDLRIARGESPNPPEKSKAEKPPLWLRLAMKLTENKLKKTMSLDVSTLPSEGSHGIKETVEACVGAKILVSSLRAALADGKLGFEDVPLLLAAQGPILDGIKDAALIKAEASDLQRAEAVAVSGYTYDLLFEVIELLNALKKNKEA